MGIPSLGDARADAAGPVEADELGASGVEADLESLDFAQPAVDAGFVDAVGQVANDLDQTVPLVGVHPEHGAAERQPVAHLDHRSRCRRSRWVAATWQFHAARSGREHGRRRFGRQLAT
jgi:hypothetical protein